MNAIICNKEHPDWGNASIPLPIPDEEYAHCISLLEQLQIGNVTARDCYIDRISGAPAYLDVLVKQEVNIDELDFLARSIDRYWGDEQPKFEAMAYKLGLEDVPSLINLSFGCEAATIITSFDDLNRTGRDHYIDTHGGAPTRVLDELDSEKLACELIATGAGTVTPYGVIFDNGLQVEPQYTGQSFPGYYDKAYLLKMELAPAPSASEDTLPTVILLPMPEKRLERMLERGGYLTADDVQICTWRSDLPDQINDCLNFKREGLLELNRMYQAIEKLESPDLDKLAAAVLMAQPEYSMQVRHLAENIDLFDFIPNVKTAEDYGKFMIRQSGHFEYDENLADFYDYTGYGEQRLEQESGEFNELGYISYHGTLSLEELMMEDPAEQFRQEQENQEMTMGGMA